MEIVSGWIAFLVKVGRVGEERCRDLGPWMGGGVP